LKTTWFAQYCAFVMCLLLMLCQLFMFRCGLFCQCPQICFLYPFNSNNHVFLIYNKILYIVHLRYFIIYGRGITPIWRYYKCLTCKTVELMKGKYLRKHSLHEKTAASVYWSCSSVVMHDATPLTPPSAWAELHFQM